MSAAWRALGILTRTVLRALFSVARAVRGIDRGLRQGASRGAFATARAFAQAIARTHRGTAQDMTLLYLAGLALLLVGRLFGS